MPQPSSTSSFSPGAYSALALATAALLAVVVAVLFHLGVVKGWVRLPESELLNTQLAKIIAESGAPDTLVVGDSSAGNAVDAQLWSQMAGRPAINLALTGGFGYPGSLNMLRRQVDRFKPANVVIIQTISIAADPPALAGHTRSSPDLFSPHMTPVEIASGLAVTAMDYLDLFALTRAVKSLGKAPEVPFVNDYIAQSAPKAESERRKRTDGPATMVVHPETVAFLGRIATYCRAQGLNCLYAHGPMYEETCRREWVYIDDLSQRVRAAGLSLVGGTPLCLPARKLGDTDNHVHPDFKPESTRAYFHLVQATLAQSAAKGTP